MAMPPLVEVSLIKMHVYAMQFYIISTQNDYFMVLKICAHGHVLM